MKLRNSIIVAAIMLISMLVFVTCSKEKSEISSTEIALAQDDSYADAIYDDVDNLVMSEATTLDENNYNTLATKSTEQVCYTVTVNHADTVTFPKIITIDFGDGCTTVFNGDTITRSGKIILTLTDRWFKTGAQQILTFENFYFNGYKVEGTRTITNNGYSSFNHVEFGVVLENGKITFDENNFITRNVNHTREIIYHLNPMNDTIIVSGTATGVNVLGEEYSRTIIEPLVFVRCSETPNRWGIVEGTMEIINSVRGIMTIEFNGDACHDDVILRKDGNRYNYRFRYRNHR